MRSMPPSGFCYVLGRILDLELYQSLKQSTSTRIPGLSPGRTPFDLNLAGPDNQSGIFKVIETTTSILIPFILSYILM